MAAGAVCPKQRGKKRRRSNRCTARKTTGSHIDAPVTAGASELPEELRLIVERIARREREGKVSAATVSDDGELQPCRVRVDDLTLGFDMEG
jgi:hypothetical protein